MCIPYVLAEIDSLKRSIDPSKTEGLRKALMLRYDGNEEFVNAVIREVNTNKKMKELAGQG